MTTLLPIVLIILAIIIVAIFVISYNALVELKNQVARSWANIEVILKQRHDEIPQLIQILEQYVDYEKSVIDSLVDARKKYVQAQSFQQKVTASDNISKAITNVLAVGENYPNLKSNENFIQLQSRISFLEEELANRRENYNNMVTNFNSRIGQIPYVFIANMLAYHGYALYEVSEREKQMPSLKLNMPHKKAP